MIVFPAIDLRGGRCVRLMQGEFERETVYDADPVAVARRFAEAGARWLHVVDLDGARAGRPEQTALVAAICKAVAIPVQVGGGLRDQAAVAATFAAGAARIVVGTVAVRDPDLLRRLCLAHRGRVAVGVDARDGRVRVSGWLEGEEVAATRVAEGAAALGAAAVIYTDIARDGTGHGPDLNGTVAVAAAARIPVLASGGIGGLDDVRAVIGLGGTGVTGMIIGRALYTGAVDLREALALAGD